MLQVARHHPLLLVHHQVVPSFQVAVPAQYNGVHHRRQRAPRVGQPRVPAPQRHAGARILVIQGQRNTTIQLVVRVTLAQVLIIQLIQRSIRRPEQEPVNMVKMKLPDKTKDFLSPCTLRAFLFGLRL